MEAQAFGHRAFLELTLPYLDSIFSVARRLTRRPSEAEALVEETYIRAFRAFPLHRDGSVRAWLVAICLNLSRSWTGPPRERVATAPTPADVYDSVVASVKQAAVVRALAQLPEEERTCVVLIDLGGLTTEEAGELLGCPRDAVLSRVHWGRRHLAALLEREGNAPYGMRTLASGRFNARRQLSSPELAATALPS
jgi:RNA polymerase sigma-70 factor (ECF subfamily)